MKSLIYIFILFFSLGLCSQNTKGQASYVVKISTNNDFFKDRKVPEQAKQRFMEMQSKLSVKNYVLAFDKETSLFVEIEEEEEQAPGDDRGRRRGGFMRMMMSSQNSGTIYKNALENKLVAQKEIYGKQFLIKDDLPKLDWVMDNEIKMIGNYTCFKATTKLTKEVENEEGEKETIEIPITAWYTIEVPVNQGPDMYWGLSGLILELHEGSGKVFICSKIQFGGEEEVEIKAPTKGKKISLEKYEVTLAKKAKEVEEMMKARRQRGPGGQGGGRR